MRSIITCLFLYFIITASAFAQVETSRKIHQLLWDNESDLYQDFRTEASPISGTKKASQEEYGDPPGWIWVQQFGGSGSDEGYAINSEQFGNIYVAGVFSGTMIIGDDTLNSTGIKDMLVMKLSPTGYPLWHRQIQGVINEELRPEQIYLDNSGNVIVTGYFDGASIDYEGTILTRTGEQDVFIAKYSPSGTFLWATSHGVSEKSFVETEIVSDVDNNYYMVCSQSYNSLMLKYNAAGQLLNDYQISSCKYTDIEINGSDLYISGTVQGWSDFGGIYMDPSGDEMFIGKMDLSGNGQWVIWANPLEYSYSFSNGLDMAIQSNGNICLFGFTSGGFIWDEDTVEFDHGQALILSSVSPDGQVNWTRLSDTSIYSGAIGYQLLSDVTDNLYLSGYVYTGTMIFDGVGLSNGRFMLKCDNTGNGLLATHLESYPNSIQVYGADKLITTGGKGGIFITRYSSGLTEELTIESTGNNGSGAIYGLETDDKANLFAFGRISGEVEWGGTNVKELSGAFLSKQNSRGELQWFELIKGAGGYSFNKGQYLVYDEVNNGLYFTGQIYDTLFIGPEILLIEEGENFIAKYSSDGTFEWVRQFTGDWDQRDVNISIDMAGNVILCSDADTDVSIGDSTFTNTGGSYIYMAKFNSDGVFKWAFKVTNTGNIDDFIASADKDNMIYFTAECSAGTMKFNGNEINTEGDTQGNVLYGKLNPGGNLLWIKTFGRGREDGRNITFSTNIITDTDGQSYLYGWHGDSVYFDDILLRKPEYKSGNFRYSYFVAKIDPEGNALWVRSIHNRTHYWSHNEIDLDEAGNFYIMANYQDSLFFENDYSLINEGEIDMLISKYYSNGDLAWVKSIESTGNSSNFIQGLAVYDSLSLYAGGQFYNQVSFDDKDLVTSGTNGFIALLSSGNINCDEFSVIASQKEGATCSDRNDGEAEVIITNGLPPYEITWDDPGESDSTNVPGLFPGIYYHVTVADQMGCSASDSILLSSPDELVVNKTYSDLVCSGNEDGYIDISVSGGTQPYEFDWSDGSESEDLDNVAAGLYTVTITDEKGCILVDTTVLDSVGVYQGSEICLLTVNNDNKILLVWEKMYDEGIVGYRIYREESKDIFIPLTDIPFNSLSIYLDETSKPTEYSHYYKITALDACGNESELSNHHKSIHLWSAMGKSGEVTLTWNEYEGFEYGRYKIYRGRHLNDLQEITSIPSSSPAWTDPDPPAGQVYYRVEVVKEEPCFPSIKKADEYGSAVSNYDEETVESVLSVSEQLISIYPNPFSNSTTLEFPNPDKQQYSLILTDLTGKVVRTMGQITSSQVELKRDNLTPGTYIIELRGDKIYRTKLLIE